MSNIVSATPLEYALLALRAYTSTPQIGVEANAARAIVEGDVVAFPGTNNLACWLADLDIETIAVPGLGTLHAGFWRALCSIREPLLALPPPAITVGHSEGAALAILFAAELCQAGHAPDAVYGFEPPRVSIDDTLATLFAAHGVQLHLYRHGEDVVPLVPRLLHSWQHPAPLIAIGTPSLPVPNVEDHFIERVIAALSQSA
ncbi:lipase family protein [Burkholderia territorii]|uniref:lipase family protein n=1 Tax=Burkholderia territorii TaxID=1503055 RepID=UPI0007560794|nr:lipase [Burkholderia territorii]KWO60436.1 lipase [Burkholderia territorii]